MFALHTPVLEIVLRGSITYLGIFLLLRLVLKRESGGVEITDVLVIVLIGDAAQNSMAGSYNSIPDGLMLVAVIIGWSALVAWINHRFPAVRRLLNAAPLMIIEDGELLRRNMRKELITDEEVASELRVREITEPKEVRRMYMEPDGEFSIIPYERERPQEPQQRQAKWRSARITATHMSQEELATEAVTGATVASCGRSGQLLGSRNRR